VADQTAASALESVQVSEGEAAMIHVSKTGWFFVDFLSLKVGTFERFAKCEG
jgi:hypothetical protein